MKPQQRIKNRLDKLQDHLKRENPMLVKIVDQYRELDSVSRKMGLLNEDESYATQISWWPMIAVLGTFSAGKSSFINSYVDMPLQQTGNQAVDDKFTVVSFSKDANSAKTLPGVALDGDPRFPFYRISSELEKVAPGEGKRIDDYLQLKVVPSEKLRGKILIDSPGFDADEQRKATLRITDHIIEISDLVLVLFDARHPEPGAMQDTLEHLVKGAAKRNDNSKFVFILNQIDTSAKDDNLEQIVSSWQKALVQKGLNSGSFLTLYNEDLAVPVEDEVVWARYVSKRQRDFDTLNARMDGIETERAYRIIGTMESLANQLENQTVPRLEVALAQWRRRVLIADAIVLGGLFIGGIILLGSFGLLDGSMIAALSSNLVSGIALLIVVLAAVYGIHHAIKGFFAKGLAKNFSTDATGDLKAAFMKSTMMIGSVFNKSPTGWTKRTKAKLEAVKLSADKFVQQLNDTFAQTTAEKKK